MLFISDMIRADCCELWPSGSPQISNYIFYTSVCICVFFSYPNRGAAFSFFSGNRTTVSTVIAGEITRNEIKWFCFFYVRKFAKSEFFLMQLVFYFFK